MEILRIKKANNPSSPPAENPCAYDPPPASDNDSPQPVTSEVLFQPAFYYQALGWLSGVVGKTEEGKLQIKLPDGNAFGVTADKRILFFLYKALETTTEQLMWVRCYPQYNIKHQVLYFKILYFTTEKPEGVTPGLFVLRGIWQFVPQNRRPVFSIYRNEKRPDEEKIKNQHLPLIWKEKQPFKFRKDSDARPEFYQIVARLIPKLGCFGWVRDLASPCKPPKRIRNGEQKKTFKPFDKKPKGGSTDTARPQEEVIAETTPGVEGVENVTLNTGTDNRELSHLDVTAPGMPEVLSLSEQEIAPTRSYVNATEEPAGSAIAYTESAPGDPAHGETTPGETAPARTAMLATARRNASAITEPATGVPAIATETTTTAAAELLTSGQLAQRLGVSPSTISKYNLFTHLTLIADNFSYADQPQIIGYYTTTI